MNYRTSVIAAVIAVLLFAGTTFAIDMRDGLWEITTKMEMPDMPMEMPPFKFTQCLTSKDSVPQDKAEHNQDCKVTNTDVKGNTVTWEVNCVSDGKPVKSTGKVTYSGDSFTGETRMETDGMKMLQKMSGRRIGNCK
ncbi:MAG: DUF3617 family protein [Nitrospirota bacterium]